MLENGASRSSFRDPARRAPWRRRWHAPSPTCGRAPVSVMHVCGSHEQAIAKFGLRAVFPQEARRDHGPGLPGLRHRRARGRRGRRAGAQGVRIATYGDMLRVPGTREVARRRPGRRRAASTSSTAPQQAVELARDDRPTKSCSSPPASRPPRSPPRRYCSTDVPPNFSVLSAHKYIPPVMEIVAEMPGSRIEGFLAAGHAATITGSADLRALRRAPQAFRSSSPASSRSTSSPPWSSWSSWSATARRAVVNMFPRCVTREGNRNAQEQLWKVFRPIGRPLARHRARAERQPAAARRIRARRRAPPLHDRLRLAVGLRAVDADRAVHLRRHHGRHRHAASTARCSARSACPTSPVGACMVSSEGTCKIWHQYGGVPDLEASA